MLDYIYATPMFIVRKSSYGIDMDVFIACNRINEENEVVEYPESVSSTIREYFTALDELDMDTLCINSKK